jgi:hypothetical protein
MPEQKKANADNDNDGEPCNDESSTPLLFLPFANKLVFILRI